MNGDTNLCVVQLNVIQSITQSAVSLLGPERACKALHGTETSEEEFILTSDTLKVVGTLTDNIQQPIARIIFDCLYAANKATGTGVTSLLALVGSLAGAARHLIFQGVPPSAVCDGFLECACVCEQECFQVRRPTPFVIPALTAERTQLQSKTKLSKIASANQATIERSLHLLAAKLQHQSRPQGRERSVSVSFALAVRAAAFVLLHLLGQRVATGDHSLSLKLDTSAVVVKKIFGAKVALNSKNSDGVGCPSGSTVWRGVVLAVHPVDRPVLEHAFAATTASTHKVVVVSGDCVPEEGAASTGASEHASAHSPASVLASAQQIASHYAHDAHAAEGNRLVRALARHAVTVVAVRGLAGTTFRHKCATQGIVVLHGLSYAEAECIANMARATAISDIQALRTSAIGRAPVRVQLVRDSNGWTPREEAPVRGGPNARHALMLTDEAPLLVRVTPTTRSGPAVTIVVRASTAALVEDTKIRVQRALSVLRNAIECGCVLPGAGATEVLCMRAVQAHRLGSLCSENRMPRMSEPYFPVVSRAFADALLGLPMQALANCGYQVSEAHSIVEKCLQIGRDCDKSKDKAAAAAPEDDRFAMFMGGRYALAPPEPARDAREEIAAHPPLHVLNAQPGVCVLDDYRSRMQQWRRAVGVVTLALMTDKVIVNRAITT